MAPPTPTWLTITTTPPDPHQPAAHGPTTRTRTGLLHEWARTIPLPPHFGHNWDALADSLRDHPDPHGPTLTVHNAQHLLADEPPHQLHTLLTLLTNIATDRPRLHLILTCPPTDAPHLRHRIHHALTNNHQHPER